MAKKGAVGVMWYHKNSVLQALIHLFPDLALQESKFSIMSRSYWKDENNRRAFFEDFAKGHRMDPLNPNTWYKLHKKVMFAKRASTVLSYYNSNAAKALMSLFPNIGLDSKKF